MLLCLALNTESAYRRYAPNVAERVTEHRGCECSKLLEETRKFSKMFTFFFFKETYSFIKAFIMGRAKYVTEQTWFK